MGILVIGLITLIITFGTFYPFFSQWNQSYESTLGAPFFAQTIPPLALIGIIFMSLAPLLTWRMTSIPIVFKYLQLPLFGGLLGLFLSLFIYDQKVFYAIAFITFSLFLMGSGIAKWIAIGIKGSLSHHGMCLAHVGVAVCLLGMTVDSYNTKEVTKVMGIGETGTLGSISFTLKNVDQQGGPNFRREVATLFLHQNDRPLATLYPEKRLYTRRNILLSEVALKQTWTSQYYAVLGDYRGNQSWLVRLYCHPLVHLIWIGGLLIALGGALTSAGRFSNSYRIPLGFQNVGRKDRASGRSVL